MNAPHSHANVERLTVAGKEIVLVGTAHISQASVELAEQVIREVRPDAVAIELCASRFEPLRSPDRWKQTNIFEVIRAGKAYVLMAQLMLASFQRRLGKQLSIKPGAEMLRAAEVADELNVPIILADRDIRVTLKRTWAALRFRNVVRLLGSVIAGLFSGETVSAEEIERLKTQDALESLMEEFTAALPEVRRTIIDERDQYLAAKIAASPGATVVAVFGAGHIPGVKRHLSQQVDLEALEQLPPKNRTLQLVGWGIPLLIVAAMVFIFFAYGTEKGVENFVQWSLINIVFTAFGATVALAHPATVIISALGSPITALHPLIAAGWVAGVVEAYLRKPQVADFEQMSDDILTLKGIYRNRITRILLVIGLTNIFAALGNILGSWLLFGALF